MNARAQDPFLVVAGTGRSGTSAVAGVLHESGVSMGTSFAGATEHNARGFYEDLAARELNARILSDLGLADLRVAPALPSRSAFLAAAEPYAAEMRLVGSTGVRSWKDPSFCFTLEAWMRALDRPAKVIVCLRGPEAYLHSVMSVVGLIERETVERWWTYHLKRVLDVIDGHALEAHCVEYDALAVDPERVVAALSRFVGAPLDAKHVNPSLRRHAFRVPLRHRALYNRALALGADGPRALAKVPDDPVGREAYLHTANQIARRVSEAKTSWEQTVDLDAMPSLSDGDSRRDASRAFDAALGAAKADLLAPPDALDAHYEALRDAIDLLRMCAHLAASSSDSSAPNNNLVERAVEVRRRAELAEAQAYDALGASAHP